MLRRRGKPLRNHVFLGVFLCSHACTCLEDLTTVVELLGVCISYIIIFCNASLILVRMPPSSAWKAEGASHYTPIAHRYILRHEIGCATQSALFESETLKVQICHPS